MIRFIKKMFICFFRILVCLLFVFKVSNSFAYDGKYGNDVVSGEAMAFEYGSLGGSISYTTRLPFYQSKVRVLNLRLGASYGIFNYPRQENNLNLDSSDSSVIGGETNYNPAFVFALVDYHPYNNRFRITTGLMKNFSQYISSSKIRNGQITVGNLTRNSINANTETNISHNSASLYLGFGYGGMPWNLKKGLFFTTSVGIIVQSEPDVDFEITGEHANRFDSQDIEDQEDKTREYFKTGGGRGSFIYLKYLPHVSLGLEIRY